MWNCIKGLWMIVKWFFDAKTRKNFMLGSPRGFRLYPNGSNKDMGGEKDFVWEHNDEEMWKKIFEDYPEVTLDNWENQIRQINRIKIT